MTKKYVAPTMTLNQIKEFLNPCSGFQYRADKFKNKDKPISIEMAIRAKIPADDIGWVLVRICRYGRVDHIFSTSELKKLKTRWEGHEADNCVLNDHDIWLYEDPKTEYLLLKKWFMTPSPKKINKAQLKGLNMDFDKEEAAIETRYHNTIDAAEVKQCKELAALEVKRKKLREKALNSIVKELKNATSR